MPSKIPYHRPAGQPKASKVYESQPQRREDNAFYGGARWKKLRALFLRENPLCVGEGCRELANTVDHIEERKARPDLEYDFDNLRAYCSACHNRRHKRRGPG